VSPDALALVRLGLRGAKDPRIRDTAKVIDALLKIETPSGSAWHRYNDDGYGEHQDGSAFDGTGTIARSVSPDSLNQAMKGLTHEHQHTHA
jgi:glucoamylase